MKLTQKKGDILDIIIFLVTLIILSIGFFTFAYIVPNITDGFNNAGLNNSVQGINAIDHLESFGVVGIQRGFFFIFVGLIMGIMVSSFFIRTHPIFIFLYIFMLAIAVILSVYLGNIYETFTANPLFAERLADQTWINLIMNNIVKIILGIGALSIVIIFSKYTIFGGSGNGL